MIAPGSAKMGLQLYRNNSKEPLNTNDYLFTPHIAEYDDHTVVTMSLRVDTDAAIEYVYTVYNTGDASPYLNFHHLVDHLKYILIL